MENELMHWGIKGMHWGIRRYQNKDGSLTPAGKKRYDKEMAKLKEEEKIAKNKLRTQAKLNKLDEKRKEIEALKKGKTLSTESQKTSKPSVKDMSDDELKRVVTRMQLEQQYKKLNPEQVSAGKRLVDKVVKDVVAPAATEVGKQVLKEAMTKAVRSASADASKNDDATKKKKN